MNDDESARLEKDFNSHVAALFRAVDELLFLDDRLTKGRGPDPDGFEAAGTACMLAISVRLGTKPEGDIALRGSIVVSLHPAVKENDRVKTRIETLFEELQRTVNRWTGVDGDTPAAIEIKQNWDSTPRNEEEDHG